MTKQTIRRTSTKTNEGSGRPSSKPSSSQHSSRRSSSRCPVVVSTGCPRGIGPEVAVVAAYQLRDRLPLVLLGDPGVLRSAARRRKLPAAFVDAWVEGADLGRETALSVTSGVHVQNPGPELSASQALLGHPRPEDGIAQLTYIEAGYQLAHARGWPLCTGPVSKEVIAHCGLPRARKFRGHTEWLEQLDGAPYSVMCFQSERLTTSLVTTHVPVRRLSHLLGAESVERSIIELHDLVSRLGKARPRLAVCSLNPHAGEGELLGSEERTAILPGVEAARARLGKRAEIIGPIGAETAYRKGAAGAYDGVVAMYHDQATIPMKLLAFGDAVNVTQGLSIVRTSVDHGTAYDIAKKGIADERGMVQAILLADRLAQKTRT